MPVSTPSRAFGLVLLAALPPAVAPAARPEPSVATERPDPVTVQRFGPAYRYPRAGWVVLHTEGTPYDRGYQHGRLLAPEIVDYLRTIAGRLSHAAPADGWRQGRRLTDALFLRRYDPEYLEEMKGIADGASAAGATFDGRPLDLTDIVVINSETEMMFLDGALAATATGLEGKTFREPPDLVPTPAAPDHCSAFAANGPATADGTIVFGHITMSGLDYVRHYNVWLDLEPSKGHRVLMQTYPGGIQSGMDYYLNDAGLIVCETTISQTKFDINGQALASRIRRALQDADSIDRAVEILKAGNNGLYTNEWLLADTKTNEIAMFELGTHKTRLWRSSKDEWFGGTKGFYWGCNNGKDVDVRLETVASVDGRPANVVWRPSDRDKAWLRLYEKHKGKISAAFGFEAFTTPPLAAFPSCDAKFTTTGMARELKTWALFGPPLGKTWGPSDADRRSRPETLPLVPNDWTILTAETPAGPDRPEEIKAAGTSTDRKVDRAVAQPAQGGKARGQGTNGAVDLRPFPEPDKDSDGPEPPHSAAWHGTILPKSDADAWLAAAFADFEEIVARERALKARAKQKKRDLTGPERDSLAAAMFAPYSRYRAAVSRLGKDVPLCETKAEIARSEWYDIAAGKGVLFLAALRKEFGDDTFLNMMDAFGRAHAGEKVSSADFLADVVAVKGDAIKPVLDAWIKETGLPSGGSDAFWSVDSFMAELDRALIVYGTRKESDAQREAASRLQRQLERRGPNVAVPVLADRDATPEALKGRHLLLVGRPDTNSVAQTMAPGLPLNFGPASFVLRGETFANAHTAVIAAGPRPDDPGHEVVVFAGLGAEASWRCVETAGATAEVILLPAVGKPRPMVVGGHAGGSKVATSR